MIRVKKEVEAGFGATIANRVADQLRDDIVSHRIQPGSRITAKEIADKYGVSSMPVREAFSMLCGENLLEMNPYRGATVIAVTPELVAQLNDLQYALESLLIELSMKKGYSEELLHQLEDVNAQMAALTEKDWREKRTEHEVSYAGLFALCRSHGLPAFCAEHQATGLHPQVSRGGLSADEPVGVGAQPADPCYPQQRRDLGGHDRQAAHSELQTVCSDRKL